MIHPSETRRDPSRADGSNHSGGPTRRTVMLGGAALTLTLAAPLGATRPGLAQSADVEGTALAKVGSREVVAFLDGRISLPAGVFQGASEQELTELIGGQAVEGFINAYVVRGPDNLVLVDAGGGSLVGPTAGNLRERMAEAGIDSSMIDVVLMTHLHPDHVGGLLGDGDLVAGDAQIVLHEREREHWMSDERMEAAGERGAGAFQAARATLEMFGERVVPIQGDGDVPGGMRSMELPGHTPGHTGFVVADGDESMLIWGDIVHAPPIQFARPEVTIGFDVDPDQARETRARVYDMVATDAIPVAGMHLAFPGIGRVVASGDAYAFEPLG